MDAEDFRKDMKIMQNPQDPRYIEITNKIISHVSCLDLLLQYLPSLVNEVGMQEVFLILVKAIKNIGGLLDFDFLNRQITYLLDFIKSKANSMISPNNISLISEAVAYSYRFLFELIIPKTAPYTFPEDPKNLFNDLFALFNNPSVSFKNIALSIMKSLVQAMKDKELKHILPSQLVDRVIPFFQRCCLYAFFQTAAQVILSQDNSLLDMALDLLNFSFQVYSNKDDSKDMDTHQFNIPQEIIPYYNDKDYSLPNALITIFMQSNENPHREKLTVENLIYFSSASENAWNTTQFSQESFFFFMADKVTYLINMGLCQQNENRLHLISRLIFKLGSIRIPVSRLIKDNPDVTVGFYMAVRNLTIFAFENFLMKELCNYLLKFWGQMANGRFNRDDISPDFVQIFPDIFISYINSLGNLNDQSIFEEIRGLEMDTYIESSKFLWHIAYVNPRVCASTVSDALSNSTQLFLSSQLDLSSKSILCKIIYILLIITSQFANRIASVVFHDDDVIQKNVILITAILNFITATSEGLEDRVNAANSLNEMFDNEEKTPFSTVLSNVELALKQFTIQISRDFFIAKDKVSKVIYKILMNLPMCDMMSFEERQQFLFDALFNRFLQDFKSNDDPFLLNELLSFIDVFILKGTNTIKTLSQNNALLQSLIQRKFILEFKRASNSISISELYTSLNKLYVKSIQSVEQFEAFLPYFDERFAQLRASNYSDGNFIYVLYSELNGALSSNGKPKLYYFIFHWFMNHVDDTINCITNHNNNQYVIESICKAWITLCSNEGQQLLLPKSSAEGIKLFQCSLKVIQALMVDNIDDIEERKKYFIQIISPSVSSKNLYVNFGIMEYFKDNSYDSMIEIFFLIINGWQFQASESNLNLISLINTINQSIIEIRPNLLSDEGKAMQIIHVLFRSMLLTSNTKTTKDNKEIFVTLTSLIELFISADIPGNIVLFRPHFIQIFDMMINLPQESISDKVSTSLYYMLLLDGEWSGHVFDVICSIFDQNNREEIDAIFKETFSIDLAPPKENGIKQLRNNLMNFKKRIMKFRINLYDIEEFRTPLIGLN